MKVSTQTIENSQVALNIEVEPTEVNRYLKGAYSRLVKKVAVPGFRKGKTPQDVLERYIGKDALFQEALEELIPKAYVEALEEQKIDAIAQPHIELLQTEPVIIKAIVPVRPTVRLGDYKGIKVDSPIVEVNNGDVEAAIEQLRHQQAILSPVDRPVQFGDTVVMDVEGRNEKESFPIREGLVYDVIKDSRLPLPGFAEKLEGMIKGEERSFVLSYPSDYEINELANKEHNFKVKATEIKEKHLPEPNDEFAVGLGHENFASLRERIMSSLKARAEERARLELEQKVVDAVVDASELEYPPILVDREIERLMDDEARHFPQGIASLENYLKSLGKSLDGHREELKPIAISRVVRALVLNRISEVEKIETDASEIDAEIEKMTAEAGDKADEMRKLFNMPQSRDSIKQFLNTRKTLEVLLRTATGAGQTPQDVEVTKT